MNVLALDLGLKCGWAMHGSHLPTLSGRERFDKSGASPGARFLEFRNWLERVAYLPGGLLAHVDLIVFEEAYQRSSGAAHSYGGFRGVLLEFCEQRGIEYRPVPANTLKKWATSKGNANKSAMMEAAANIDRRVAALGPVVQCLVPRMNAWCAVEKPTKDQMEGEWSDECDAICLLAFALAEVVPKEAT